MSGLRTFFISPRRLGFHFLLAIVVFFILSIATYWTLNIYSRHGSEEVMPDFIGMHVQELLNNEIVSQDFIIVISDYLFDRNTLPGIVLKQDPHVGEMVKKGRKVYVTVASNEPPKVIMPQLQDVSLRQAELMLKAIGLELGAVILKSSPYENAILEQLYKGRTILPGTQINAGEMITLVVGRNPEELPYDIENEIEEQ